MCILIYNIFYMGSSLCKNGAALIAVSILLLPVISSKTVWAEKPVLAHKHKVDLVAQRTYSSGIEGIVIISPISPVERPGTINFRPYLANITVLNATGEIVIQFQSRTDGVFRVELKPGIYVLRPESNGVYPRAEEHTVTVSKNKFTRILINYDSGIR